MRSCLALPSLVLAISTALAAQMSGAYTIDPNGTGTRNYTSFGAAVYELWQKGIGAPVTFTVAPGSYKENWALIPIKGMSATNKLTFKSQIKHKAVLEPGTGTILTFALSSPTNPIVGLVLDGLAFASASYGIYARTDSTDVEVRHCSFANTIKSNHVYSIYGTRWDIHHCVISAGIPGSTSSAILFSYHDETSIHHNEIKLNEGRGIVISSSSKTAPGPTRIYNNIITGKHRNISNYGAINLSSYAYGVEVAHNTVLIDGVGSSVSCIRVTGLITKPHKVYSNIFVNMSPGPVMIVDSVSAYNYRMDGNLYYSTRSANIVQLYQGLSYGSLSAWQQASGQDKSSIQADPLFMGGFTSPYDVHLKQNSPAIGKAVNTPAYVTDDFEGTKRPAKPTIGAYEAIPPPTFTPFGTGCAGTGGIVPVLGYSGDLKTGSTNFAITLDKAVGGLFVNAFFAVGASKTTWNGTPLPINLGGGCSLLVAPHILLLRSVSGPAGAGNGAASVTLGIPNDPKLRGVEAHFQWAVVDPAAAGISLAFSNAATVKI